jgi:FkbM family methyltransferase
MKMKTQIVEIGTSDFRTEAGKTKGLFVEPIKEYFDRLPECIKENVAVSNYSGEIDIYHIPSKTIAANKLPSWLRGCNSVGSIHPTIVKMNLESHVVKNTVKVMRIKELLEKHGIYEIEFLKIDTEGHDCIILNDFLNTCDIKPNKIQFENNELSNHQEIMMICNRLQDLGYNIRKVGFDIIADL